MVSAPVVESETAGQGARRIDYRRRGDGSFQGIPRLISAVVFIASIGSMLWMYFRHVGTNPAGFFCDEAEIGFRAWQLIKGTLPDGVSRLPIFYPHLGTVQTGALPLYTTAPFLMLFGPSDWSVRLASVFWSSVAIVALLLLCRVLNLMNGWIGVVAFALSPIAIHISRIQFAHAGSFAAVSLGLLLYAIARERRSVSLTAGAGVLIGLSVYGFGAWYFAAPLLMVSLAVGECCANGLLRRNWRQWRTFLVAAVSCVIVWIPVVYQLVTNPAFTDRLRDKEASAGVGSGWSLDRVHSMLDQYPKYFSLDYLFRYGEVGPILRHSVQGAGLLSWTVLPLVLCGVFAVIREPRGTAKVVGIAAIGTLVMMPFPDLPSSGPGNPPYTFTVYSMLIGVPILCAFGVRFFGGMVAGRRSSGWRRIVIPILLSAIVLFSSWSFYRGPYADYRSEAAGYWGWQFGPGPAIAEFIADNGQHDQYVLDGDFNGPGAFLDFYLAEYPEIRTKALVGRIGELGLSRNALYAVRADRWDNVIGSHDPVRQHAEIVKVIYYPDGTPAMYVISVSLENVPTPVDNW